jgi:SHS family lactate transporter-like MFS transporter
MAIAAAAGISDLSIPWWKEPTKDHWFAWAAATFGWMLDAFDYTIFLFIMVPISKEFGVSVTAVAAVLSVTIWLRFVGAIGAGWLADRIGRKGPLMLSILWFSICNFIAGFSPSFAFLFVVRAALGIGMGAEWPAGAASRWSRGRHAHVASWEAFSKVLFRSDLRWQVFAIGSFPM